MNNITQTVFTISIISFNKFVSVFWFLILLLVGLSSYGHIIITSNGTAIATTSGSNAKIISEAFTSQKEENDATSNPKVITSFHNKKVTLGCYFKQSNFYSFDRFDFKT